MRNGKNGLILDSQNPFVGEVAGVYIFGLIGGVVGFLISIFNENSFFEALIAAAFFYLFAFVVADVFYGGTKYTALQMRDYDLPGGAISPEQLYNAIASKLSSYGKLEIKNRSLSLVADGLIYLINIDYQKNNFRISIIKRFSSLSPINNLRTGRYNKAIVIIPIIVFNIQQVVANINGVNNE